MLESELQAAVLECGAVLGWLCFHARPARTRHGWRTAGQGNGAKGFPDTVLVRRDRLVFMELKAKAGRLSAEQEAWIALLREAGAEAHVITTSDWESGAVERILR